MREQEKEKLRKIFISLHKPTITLINKRIEKEFKLIKNQIERGFPLDAVLNENMILQREGIKSYVELYYTYLFENVIDFIEENFDSDDEDDDDEDEVEDDSNTSTESNE